MPLFLPLDLPMGKTFFKVNNSSSRATTILVVDLEQVSAWIVFVFMKDNESQAVAEDFIIDQGESLYSVNQLKSIVWISISVLHPFFCVLKVQ